MLLIFEHSMIAVTTARRYSFEITNIIPCKCYDERLVSTMTRIQLTRIVFVIKEGAISSYSMKNLEK